MNIECRSRLGNIFTLKEIARDLFWTFVKLKKASDKIGTGQRSVRKSVEAVWAKNC